MVIDMNDAQLKTLAQLKAFFGWECGGRFPPCGRRFGALRAHQGGAGALWLRQVARMLEKLRVEFTSHARSRGDNWVGRSARSRLERALHPGANERTCGRQLRGGHRKARHMLGDPDHGIQTVIGMS